MTNIAKVFLVGMLLCALSLCAKEIDVLCIYYPEWHVYPEGDVIFGKGRTEWEFVKTAPARFPGHEQPIVPSLGYLDDSNPDHVAKEIDLASDAGIDVFVYDWYWADGHPIQHEALERGFMKAANRSKMKFAIMWAYHDRSDAFRPEPGHTYDRHFWRLSHTDEEFLDAIGYCMRTYFRDPCYYVKDGKLFFSMYSAGEFTRKHGGPGKTRALLQRARDMVKAAGLPPLHFSAMVYNPDDVSFVVLSGFESTSVYCMSPLDIRGGPARSRKGEQVFSYDEFAAAQPKMNMALADVSPMHIPLAVRGWDASARCRVDEPFPWRVHKYPYMGIVHGATPEKFAKILREARRQALNDPKKPGAVLINAWNEFTEGSYLVPDEKNGSGYLDAVKSVFSENAVYSSGFDSPDEVKGWGLDSVWKVEPGAGVGGSAALVWTNTDPSQYRICNFHQVPGAKAGRSYRATFKVKAYDAPSTRVNGSICWCDDGGKFLGAAGGTVELWGDKRLKPDADGWYEMSVRTTPFLPPTAAKSLMQLFIHRGGTGRVAFDDVRIELVDEKEVGSVDALVSSRYRDIAADGDVRFVATIEIPRDCWGRTVATLSYSAADGSSKTVAMSVPDAEHAETTLPVSALAMGRHKVTVSVKGEDGRLFGERALDFERVAEMPSRGVWIDRFNRTFIDGKPFFPLGMFWSIGTLERYPDALDRYATGPFNCLQNYDHTFTTKELDRFWAKGLRVLVGVKDAFAPHIPPNVLLPGDQSVPYARPKKGTVLKSHDDEDRYLADKANSLKDHPGFLGWYGCDEFPERFHDRLKERYELLKRVDPGHPVFFSVTRSTTSRRFVDCADAIGFDAYDIHNIYTVPTTKPEFGEAWRGAEKTQSVIDSTYGCVCVWQVPQAFSKNWDFKGKRPELGFPTFNELKSQVWQEIAVGANGLFFYSYSQILGSDESGETDETKAEYLRRTWAVAREVRDMIPILTLEPGPSASAKPERVLVRTWRDGGAVYALVCNTHPEPRTGTVRVEGGWKSAKPVFGGGVSLKDGALVLDMPNFGVSIVKLEE